jgi:hypothetical protein
MYELTAMMHFLHMIHASKLDDTYLLIKFMCGFLSLSLIFCLLCGSYACLFSKAPPYELFISEGRITCSGKYVVDQDLTQDLDSDTNNRSSSISPTIKLR